MIRFIGFSRFALYTLSSYLLLMALIHNVITCTLYPSLVHHIAQLQLLPWIAPSVQKQKLLSVVQYLAVCGCTPFFAVHACYQYQRCKRFFSRFAWLPLLVLFVANGAFFISSYWIIDLSLSISVPLTISLAACFVISLLLPLKDH